MKETTVNTILIISYLACFLFIVGVYYGSTIQRKEIRKKHHSDIFEHGYLLGAKSGAELISIDSLSYQDWLIIKKKDSLDFINRNNK